MTLLFGGILLLLLYSLFFWLFRPIVQRVSWPCHASICTRLLNISTSYRSHHRRNSLKLLHVERRLRLTFVSDGSGQGSGFRLLLSAVPTSSGTRTSARARRTNRRKNRRKNRRSRRRGSDRKKNANVTSSSSSSSSAARNKTATVESSSRRRSKSGGSKRRRKQTTPPAPE